MVHMLSKSEPLDFYLTYKADVIISQVSFVNTPTGFFKSMAISVG